MNHLTTNEAGFNLIKACEGCRLHSYQDIGGVWTIGYGHTPSGPGISITQDQADELLRKDLYSRECFLNDWCDRNDVFLTSNQFSALMSLVFNCGYKPLYHTLGHKVMDRDIPGAAQEFLAYCHVNGTEVEGLLHRRQAEKALFLKPDEPAQAT